MGEREREREKERVGERERERETPLSALITRRKQRKWKYLKLTLRSNEG